MLLVLDLCKYCQGQRHEALLLCFLLCLPLGLLTVSALTKSVSLCVDFCVWCKIRVRFNSFFFSCEYPIQLSHYHLLKKLSFPFHVLLPLLPKINWPYICVFISRFSILLHWSVCFYASTILFDFCSFIIYFQIREKDKYNFVLIFQDRFVYSWSLVVPYELQNFFFYFCGKKKLWDFYRNCTECVG